MSTNPHHVVDLRLPKQHPVGSTSLASALEPTYVGDTPRTSVLMELTDRVGVLHDVLRYFWKHDVNVSRIESRPVHGPQTKRSFDFFVDFDGQRGDRNVAKLLKSLETMTDKLLILDEKEVRFIAIYLTY